KNIPLPDLLIDESREILSQPGRDFIFYSTGDVYANQAWMLARRLGYKRLYVLSDGLNRWIETIIQPSAPDPTLPQEAIDLYQFRLGAAQYFSGGQIDVQTFEPQEEIEFTRKKKKRAAEGGC
ncbi:MAG: rhodanese-like domain-containing protein, partial [Bacteroidota bacterium]